MDARGMEPRKGVQDCPVFHPTEEEFKDFSKYIESIEAMAMPFGACRIVPPKTWRPRASPYDAPEVDSIMLEAPVKQEPMGKAGSYTVANILQKPMTIAQYKVMASKPENAPPTAARGEEMGRSSRSEATGEDEYAWIEKRYWQGFLHKPAVYGSDNHSNTLFEDCAGEWNLSCLPTMLRDKIRYRMPGINSPYLYMGMWRACFCWHVEDMDLYSINYLHWGEPKLWYAVGASHSQRMETMACALHPTLAHECKQFLRHKGTMISPSHLISAQIPVTRVVQQPGEFVVTMPYAYHSGFNLGLNCAEAVNFASDRWLPYGRKAKLCSCFPDTVHIQMAIFEGDGTGGGDAVCLEETIDDIVCERCKEGTDDDIIVLCDKCTGGYHLACCRPVLKEVPRGRWICDVCVKEAEDSEAGGGRGIKGKCCACGAGCEDIRLMEPLRELSDAWHSDESLGAFPKDRFLVCEACSDARAEADWSVSEEDGQCGVCLWCASNHASLAKGPDLLCCSRCHRSVCEACINRCYPKGSLQKIKEDDNWLCAVCNIAALATKKEKAAGLAALDAAKKAIQGWKGTEVDKLIRLLRTGGVGGWTGVVEGVGKEDGLVKGAVTKLKKLKGGALWTELGLSRDSWEMGVGRVSACHFCGGKGRVGTMFACGVGKCQMRFCASCLEQHFPSSWDFLIDAAAKVARPVNDAGEGGWPYDRQIWPEEKGVGVAVREAGELVAGDLLECEDMGGFYAARVLDVQQRGSGREGMHVKVHFTGWKERYDHWVPLCSPRLCDRSKNSKDLEVEKYAKGGQMVRKVPDNVRMEIKVFAKKRKGTLPAGEKKKRKVEARDGGLDKKKRSVAPPRPEPRRGVRASTRGKGAGGAGSSVWTGLPSVVSWFSPRGRREIDLEGVGAAKTATEKKDGAEMEIEDAQELTSKGQATSAVPLSKTDSNVKQASAGAAEEAGGVQKGDAKGRNGVDEGTEESKDTYGGAQAQLEQPRVSVSDPAAPTPLASPVKGKDRVSVEYLSSWTCPVCALECPCAMKDPSGVDPCLRMKQRLGRKRKNGGDAKGEDKDGEGGVQDDAEGGNGAGGE